VFKSAEETNQSEPLPHQIGYNRRVSMNKITDPIARVLISAIFLSSGYFKAAHFSATAQSLAGLHIPLPTLAAMVAILIEIGGALAILVGWHARLAAWLQFLYLVPVTIMIHNFWTAAGAIQQDQTAHFMKNVAIMGGLLFFTQYGPGETAVDTSHK
jgi:putative oxidoreductase